MNRYFIPTDQWKDEHLSLSDEEARHCSRVMRASEGDEIEIFDGAGVYATCRVSSISRNAVHCDIISKTTSPPVKHPVTLCQAIPKGSNMEWIVQKAVELGVNKIQPLITAHTVARPESVEKKSTKWQRVALEACKQCGQNYLPEIAMPQSYDTWLQNFSFDGARLIAALDERAIHLKDSFVAQAPAGGVALLIGPEGDFSDQEYDAAFKANFQAVSFGGIVLRVETASLYGLSVIQHELSAQGQ